MDVERARAGGRNGPAAAEEARIDAAAAPTSWWSTEFLDPAVERAYRAQERPAVARRARSSLAFGWLILLAFTVQNVLVHQAGARQLLLAGIVCALALPIGLLVYLIGRDPIWVERHWFLSLIEFAAIGLVILAEVLGTDDADTLTLCLCVIVLSYFIFITNRYLHTLVVSATAVAAYLTLPGTTGCPSVRGWPWW